jgi:outer membrane protein OmpA-like peptidoglycan-associated protein
MIANTWFGCRKIPEKIFKFVWKLSNNCRNILPEPEDPESKPMEKAMKRIVLSILVLVCLVGVSAQAGDNTGRVGLGADFGIHKLLGGNHDYSNVDQFGGLHFRYGLSSHWTLDAQMKYGTARPGSLPGEDAGFTFDAVYAYYTTMVQGMAGARYNFSPDSSFNPFGSMHFGFMDWKVRDETGTTGSIGLFPGGPVLHGFTNSWDATTLESLNLTASLGLGLEFFLSKSISLDLSARYTFIMDNTIDNIGSGTLFGPSEVDANQALFDAFMGLTFYFGGNKDKDGDGLENKYDRCPDDAEDFDGYMDEDGCPDPDNDGDGILDINDNCPDDAEDMDGYKDDDGCPDPDNDGDGVLDVDDQCPEEMEDMDGFEDEDGCPDPDNDGDGVLDADDQCANTPTGVEVDANGCPIIAEIKPTMVLTGVTFTVGKAELTYDSQAVLDNVGASLHAWPEATIEIQGHTDSTGSADLNRAISMLRADAVREYLIGKGIDPARMTAIGYGEDLPVGNNATVEGRAKNRRVELVRTDKPVDSD